MIPGKLYKAAIVAAMAAFALTLPVSGAQAQQHGTKRWQYQTQQQYRHGGGESRRMRSSEGSGPRLERRIERRIRRYDGPSMQVEPRVNRAERRIRRSESRRIHTSPVITDLQPRVRIDDRRVTSKKRHTFRYNNRHHGKRYKKRRPGFTHYYNGYWYALPFWLYSYDYYEPYYYGDGVSDWELHVEWCHNRYRSYREDLDAYKGYDGKWHRCISPYSY